MQVTKAVWAYIHEAKLQDPKDGRKIRNDDKMFRVFKCKTMNMMQIQGKLTPHLKKYSELVGNEGGGGAGPRGETEERESGEERRGQRVRRQRVGTETE